MAQTVKINGQKLDFNDPYEVMFHLLLDVTNNGERLNSVDKRSNNNGKRSNNNQEEIINLKKELNNLKEIVLALTNTK